MEARLSTIIFVVVLLQVVVAEVAFLVVYQTLVIIQHSLVEAEVVTYALCSN